MRSFSDCESHYHLLWESVEMGGKRRSSKAQGIRKKKKSKQTLAKVEERKEKQQEILEAKIKNANKQNIALRSSIYNDGRSTVKERFHSSKPNASKHTTFPLQGEKLTRLQKVQQNKAQHRTMAYNSLMRDLNFSITEKDRNGKQTQKQEKRMKNELSSTNDVFHEQMGDISDNEIETSMLESENRSAAHREQTHFSSCLKPENISKKLVHLDTHLAGLKVNTNLPEPERSEFSKMLNANANKVGVHSLGLQPSLYPKWKELRNNRDQLSNSFQRFATYIECLRTYRDVILCQKFNNNEEDLFRHLYIAHIVAHVLRCRARVLRNDHNRNEGIQEEEELLKDQGFNRARILILAPLKNVAYDIVQTIVALVVGAKLDGNDEIQQVSNSERFKAEFSPDTEDEIEDEEEESSMPTESDPAASIRKSKTKPEDYRRIFRGNIDDDFKIGISFARKSVKLYTDFYASDVIIASPIGLQRSVAEKMAGTDALSRMNAEKKKEEEETEWKTSLLDSYEKRSAHESDDGFLSSIEICVVDGAHVFSMQNWDILTKTMAMVNKMPESTRDTDFSRVRDWCLDGLMERFRQTVVLSKYRNSNIVSLSRGFCNHDGMVHLLDTPEDRGSMTKVVVNMRQTFFKVPDVTNPLEAPDQRFSYFFKHIFPLLRSVTDSQCLIIIPSYFDFVRVRNAMVKLNEDDSTFQFASMCEYSKGSDISRARSKLYDRFVSVVIMTERFHFYWRHWIRGANTIVWYGLPENSNYYPEISNMTAEAAEAGRPVQSFALYDRFDSFTLERIVGYQRSRKMVGANSKSTYLFTS